MTLQLEAEIEVEDGLQQLGFDTIGEQLKVTVPINCPYIKEIRKIKISRTVYDSAWCDDDPGAFTKETPAITKETPAMPMIRDSEESKEKGGDFNDDIGMVEFPHHL